MILFAGLMIWTPLDMRQMVLLFHRSFEIFLHGDNERSMRADSNCKILSAQNCPKTKEVLRATF